MSRHAWRFESTLAALLVAGMCIAILPAAVAASSSSHRIPTQLLILAKRMRSLSINSERLVRRVALHVPSSSTIHSSGSKRKTDSRRPKSTTHWLSSVYEASRSPLRGIARSGARGHRRVEWIQVGDEEYLRDPVRDVKRRWLRITLHKGQGELAYLVGKGPRSLIGRLASELSSAESAVDLGSVVVLGHQTTEFRVRTSVKETARLIIVGGSHGHTRPKAIHRRRRLTLRVFIEPGGLPVRVEEDTYFGQLMVETGTDVLATEIPVHVKAPPKRETITLAELEQHSKAPKA